VLQLPHSSLSSAVADAARLGDALPETNAFSTRDVAVAVARVATIFAVRLEAAGGFHVCAR